MLYSLSIFHATPFPAAAAAYSAAIGRRNSSDSSDFPAPLPRPSGEYYITRNTVSSVTEDVAAGISVLLGETGQERRPPVMKRKAIGARRQTGAAEGESKVVLAIRVRTSMCLRTVVGVYGAVLSDSSYSPGTRLRGYPGEKKTTPGVLLNIYLPRSLIHFLDDGRTWGGVLFVADF